eukprot:TRINITY_DN38216_c0_g1_i1.p1 TRINITY_DN38216_c0_g1~~TRINITY_DN38216_c0_g1_i1.p1  ORF type:complete len:718 (+),score=291.05 TRINITY_DN38216_c0_g1_i1:76-2154(+)
MGHNDQALSSTEVLVAFSPDADFEQVSEKVTLTKTTLEKEGYVVTVDSSGIELVKGQARFLVVQTPMHIIEETAEQQGYLKAVVQADPLQETEDKMEFIRSGAEGKYKGYGTDTFWTPSEEVELILSALDQVEAAAPLVPSSNLLLPGLRILHLLEVVAPLHQQTSLKRLWSSTKWTLFVPEDLIQEYFGSGVAFYFSWLNYFTLWLMGPAVVGFLFFLHMQVTDYCVDNHPYLPFYSLLVVFWAATFTSLWRQRSARKAWDWGTDTVSQRTEVRAEFKGELRKSRITGRPERYFPYYKRVMAYGVSAAVTAAMLCVAFCVMVLSLNLQGYIDGKIQWEEPLYFPTLSIYAVEGAIFDPNQTEYFGLLALIPTLLHVLVIMQLNALYRQVAEWLTHRENHRLQEEHESSLILKRFLFESFDCYISLFYLGFVQQDIRRLRLELISLYTVDSIRRAALETLLPFLLNLVRRTTQKDAIAEMKKRDEKGSLVPAFQETHLPEYEPFDDYLEMVIEFGYVTLFAASFPLAALLSVLCNFLEMKSDLFKLCKVYRRPAAERANGIGVWQGLIKTLMWLSIFTNTFLFASSEQLAAHVPWLYRHANERDLHAGRVSSIGDADHDLVVKRGSHRWVLIIAFLVERAVFLLCLLVQTMIPEVSEDVTEERERRKYLKDIAFRTQLVREGRVAEGSRGKE